MRTWADRFPERLEHELAELAELGWDFQPDTLLLEEQGRVVLHGLLPYDGAPLRLEIHYPDLFPYLRPEVAAPCLDLGRHQNPFTKSLCLLDHSTRAWDPSMTAAWLVERIPRLLELASEPSAAAGDEEAPQGEPASAYFGSVPGTAVFVPGEALELPSDAKAGSGRIACSVAEPPRLRLRGLVAEVAERTAKRKTRTLARADSRLLSRFAGETIPFRWVRLDSAPLRDSPYAVLEAIESARPGFGAPPWRSTPDGQLAVTAAVFREEVQQGRFEDAWLFAVRVREPSGAPAAYLVRGERLACDDLRARLPADVQMEDRTVAVVGLGAIGAEIALELARVGTHEIRGLDFDGVETGTIVRWPIGLSAVGHPKTDVIASRIQMDYPYTDFKRYFHRLGGSALMTTGRRETELDLLDRFLDGVDLVVDASAEIGIQQLMAAEAGEREVPQLYVSTTEGARGGMVAKVTPGQTGCWLCLQWHLETGSIEIPAWGAAATLQPRGCAGLTYRGAGFDVLPTVAQAVRVATAPPALDARASSVFVCSFPDERPGPPSWREYPLKRHPACPSCSPLV